MSNMFTGTMNTQLESNSSLTLSIVIVIFFLLLTIVLYKYQKIFTQIELIDITTRTLLLFLLMYFRNSIHESNDYSLVSLFAVFYFLYVLVRKYV